MSLLRTMCAAWLALALTGCMAPSLPTQPSQPPHERPTRAFPPLGEVRDSVYLPLERNASPPAGYGLYTVLLTRTIDRNTLRVLSELLVSTGPAGDAALAHENLNLITIPVKNSADSTLRLSTARTQPEAAATALMQNAYDFGHAALLLASVCRPERGLAVMKVCGSAAPDGPLLVTTLRPLDGAATPGQRLLVVNLATTPLEALREVFAAYRRQIQRKDFADRAELEGWRLWALNRLLDTAQLLPGISKAYAGSR